MSESAELPKAARRATRWRKHRRTLLEVALVILAVLAIRTWQQRDAAEGPAPALPGLAELRAEAPGEPVLVHFWATWCGVCQAEEDNVVSVSEGHRVLSVASRSGDPAQVIAYAESHGFDFPVVQDRSGELASRWGVTAYPTSFVVAPDGTISDVEVGYTTTLGLRARLWWAR